MRMMKFFFYVKYIVDRVKHSSSYFLKRGKSCFFFKPKPTHIVNKFYDYIFLNLYFWMYIQIQKAFFVIVLSLNFAFVLFRFERLFYIFRCIHQSMYKNISFIFFFFFIILFFYDIIIYFCLFLAMIHSPLVLFASSFFFDL